MPLLNILGALGPGRKRSATVEPLRNLVKVQFCFDHSNRTEQNPMGALLYYSDGGWKFSARLT
jgi:hypothetical protein